MVPVNPDGSITVKMARSETLDVNVREIGGSSIFGSNIPVTMGRSGETLDVNIDKIGGNSVYGGKIPVKIEK